MAWSTRPRPLRSTPRRGRRPAVDGVPAVPEPGPDPDPDQDAFKERWDVAAAGVAKEPDGAPPPPPPPRTVRLPTGVVARARATDAAVGFVNPSGEPTAGPGPWLAVPTRAGVKAATRCTNDTSWPRALALPPLPLPPPPPLPPPVPNLLPVRRRAADDDRVLCPPGPRLPPRGAAWVLGKWGSDEASKAPLGPAPGSRLPPRARAGVATALRPARALPWAAPLCCTTMGPLERSWLVKGPRWVSVTAGFAPTGTRGDRAPAPPATCPIAPAEPPPSRGP